MPEPHRGLFWPVEKVADAGVLKPDGDWLRYGYWSAGLAGRYISCEYLCRESPAMTNGAGRGLASLWLNTEETEPILEVDREFRWCPRSWPFWLPAVDALDLLPGGRTRSVRTCLWNLVPVAAKES